MEEVIIFSPPLENKAHLGFIFTSGRIFLEIDKALRALSWVEVEDKSPSTSNY